MFSSIVLRSPDCMRLALVACLSGLTLSTAHGWGDQSPQSDQFRNMTESRDLLGRWRYKSIQYLGAEESRLDGLHSMDIISCGGHYCGIAVGKDGACGKVVLNFEDHGRKHIDTLPMLFDRFSGALDLPDKTDCIPSSWMSIRTNRCPARNQNMITRQF